MSGIEARNAASIRFIHLKLDKITDIMQLGVVDGEEKLFVLMIAQLGSHFAFL